MPHLKWWIAFWLLFSSVPAKASEDFRQLTLELGASLLVKSPATTQWHAHKNQIVEIMPAGAGEWRLVAVNVGLVIVEALNEDGKLQQRLLITVAKKTEQREGREGRESVGGTEISVLPGDIKRACERQPNGFCEGQKKLSFSGEVLTAEDYLLLRQYCLKHLYCAFTMQPVGEAKQDVKELLAAEEGVTAETIRIGHDGIIHISMVCASNAKLPNKSETKGVVWQCDTQSERNLWLQFHVSVIGETADQKTGVWLEPLIQGDVWHGEALKLGLENQASKHKQTIIGQPIFRVLSGQEATFSGGSELFVGREIGLSKAEPWKKLGLSIKVLPRWLASGLLRLAFDVSVSEPKQSQDRTILQHALQSEQILAFEEEHVLAVVATEQNAEEEWEIPLLSSLPILGPLFKRKAEGGGKTYLKISATAFQAEPQAIKDLL